MSISYSGSQIQVLDDNGYPASGAKINFYEPATTTRKDTYTDSNKSVVNSNPVICDANGRAQVWLSGGYKVVTTDSADVAIGDTIDNYNASTTVANEGVLVLNGSFEDDVSVSGQPDNWTVSAGTNGVIAIDSTDQVHGLKSLKFTGTDATGGGTTTSNKFNVLAGGDIDISYSYKSSSATTTNKLQIKWYDSAGAVVSTTDIFNVSTVNPTSWKSSISRATAPATAVQAEVILTGVGSATTGSTWFDNISVQQLTIDIPVFLSKKTASNSPTIEFTTADFTATAYKRYRIEVYGLLAATLTNDLRMRISQAGAFITASDYHTNGTAIASSYEIIASITMPANNLLHGSIDIVISNGADREMGMSSFQVGTGSSGGVRRDEGEHSRNDAIQTDGFQLFFGTGNITSGVFKLFGIPD